MTISFNLSLPIDIPWKRVCVTSDMIDKDVCDGQFPPKWHSSIAVFKYVPDEPYQKYPDYQISYLKVAVTVGGYQPQQSEIEGEIDWKGLNTETIADVEALLSEYMPCSGAVVQVAVQAPQKNLSQEKQPFFLDFEPKKRELYEIATDTLERSSRSLETLNLSKSAGTTQSVEVLDVDMGGSFAAQGEASFGGTGGGFGFSTSKQGEWGTKSLTSHESGVIRTTDHAQEKRETHSFTTQLSQLYHLLTSYHLGTNRAVFFIQPRPHVIEEPSGFVRGPRPIEGVQEFFLVVAQPKGQGDYCVSVRLDTAHLTEIDILEHERRTDTFDLQAAASPPAAEDPDKQPAGEKRIEVEALGFYIGDRIYKCFKKTVTDAQVYTPPWKDYLIESFEPKWHEKNHGDGSFQLAANGESLDAKVWAWARRCFEDGGVLCLDCPDSIGEYSGLARATVLVNLVTREPTKKVGTEQVLLVTTRGICCCPPKRITSVGIGILGWRPVRKVVRDLGHLVHSRLEDLFPEPEPPGPPPVEARPGRPEAEAGEAPRLTAEAARIAARAAPAVTATRLRRGMTARSANALGQLIAEELRRRSSSSAPGAPLPYLFSDLFLHKLERRLRQHAGGRRWLGRRAKLPEGADPAGLRALFDKAPGEVTNRELAVTATPELARQLRVPEKDLRGARLSALGIRIKPKKDEEEPE